MSDRWLSPQERAYTDGWRHGMWLGHIPRERGEAFTEKELRAYKRGLRDGQHRRVNLSRRDER